MTSRRDAAAAVIVAALLVLPAGSSVASGVDVKVAAGAVRIQATTTSVSEVLDRLARATGMKIVYEGPPPSDRVSASIDARSETEAISRLLEGLGLTYAFKLDTAGRKVETLFITTTSGSSARRTSTPPARRTEVVEEMAEEGEPTMVDVPEPPEQGTAPELPPSGTMGGGGLMSGPPGVPADPAQQAPTFPSPASYPMAPGVNPTFPGNPTFPAAPVMPTPYSYPSSNN